MSVAPGPVQFPVINPAEADRFLSTFGTDLFTFQTFDDSEQKRNHLARILHGTREMNHAALVDLNRNGAGVFVTINETDFGGRTRENITKVRAYFADGDEMLPDNCWRLELEPTCMWESSPGKFNFLYLIEDAPLDRGHFRLAQLRLARLFGSDQSVNDLPRVMRLPGFVHQKDPNKPFMSRIHYLNPNARYTEAQFQAALEAGRNRYPDQMKLMEREEIANTRARHSAPKAAGAAAPPRTPRTFGIVGDTREPAPPETLYEIEKLRSTFPYLDPSDYLQWFKYMAALKSTGWSDETVLALADELSQRTTRNNYPGRDGVWAKLCQIRADRNGITERTIYKDAIAAGWEEPPMQQQAPPAQPSFGPQPGPRPGPQWGQQLGPQPGVWSSQQAPQDILASLRWHDDAAEIEPPPQLVKNMLPETGIAFLSGQWGTAKTFVALELAVAVARGMPFANQKVKRPGGVLYLAAEGSSQIPIRLKALKLKYPIAMFKVPMPFAWLDYCPPFVAPANSFSLMQFAKAVAEEMPKKHNVPLVLIIIDTLAAAANFKDANDAAEAQKVMNMLNDISKETKALVLPVDHFGKDADAGTRGSSAKEAAADAVIACLNKRTQEGRVSDFKIAVRKLRGGAAGTETPYELEEVNLGKDNDGDDITSCKIKWSPVAIPPEAIKAKSPEWPKGAFRQALFTALAGQPTVAADRVKAEFNKLQPPDKSYDAKRKAFDRSWDTAVEQGLITVHEINGATFVGLKAVSNPPSPGTGRSPGRTDRTLS
jgi:hypothetical protein